MLCIHPLVESYLADIVYILRIFFSTYVAILALTMQLPKINLFVRRYFPNVLLLYAQIELTKKSLTGWYPVPRTFCLRPKWLACVCSVFSKTGYMRSRILCSFMCNICLRISASCEFWQRFGDQVWITVLRREWVLKTKWFRDQLSIHVYVTWNENSTVVF